MLRLLLSEPKIWEKLVQCPRCEWEGISAGWGKDEARRCSECDGVRTLLDAKWWERASHRVRQACVRDRSLIPTVKAEWKQLHDGAPLPRFPERFAWLNEAWEKAGRPNGRPFSPLKHYQLAYVVGWLESAVVSSGHILNILKEPKEEIRLQLYDELPDRVHRFLGETTSACSVPSVAQKSCGNVSGGRGSSGLIRWHVCVGRESTRRASPRR